MATFTIDVPGVVRVEIASHDGAGELGNAIARAIAEQTGQPVTLVNNESGKRVRYEVRRVEKWEVRKRG